MENNIPAEKPKETKKKSGPIIIVLLLVVIVLLGGFIFINRDKLFGEKETNTPEETEVVEDENVTFTDEELQKYVDYIQPVSIGPSAKLYNVDKVVASELSAGEKVAYVGHDVYAKHTTSSDYNYDIIAEEDVKKVVEEVYGPNAYERATFNLGCGDYEFHEDDSKYYSRTGCGGTTDKLSANVVIDYKATKTKLEITTAYAFADSEFKIYKDFEFTNAIDDFTTDYSEMVSYLKKYAKENKDKLSHIVYVFESKDGENYYFKEFTNNR